MSTNKIIIFGTAEIAELALFYFQNDSNYKVEGFVIDDSYFKETTFKKKPIIPFSDLNKHFPSTDFDGHVALSYKRLNQLREEKYFQMKKAGYKLASYISSKATTWNDLSYGDNCFILENQNIQPTVKIGNNVMLWSNNHIGHGTIIHDHVYLASNICLSGHTNIGKRTFIGVNAACRDFCQIGSDCFIAMGANITQKKIPDGSVVIASQSKTLLSDDIKAKKIKQSYFGV